MSKRFAVLLCLTFTLTLVPQISRIVEFGVSPFPVILGAVSALGLLGTVLSYRRGRAKRVAED